MSAPVFTIPGDGTWVDDVLLGGPDNQCCLRMSTPIDRALLRTMVDDRQRELRAAGLASGSTIALHLPPSMAFVTALLAAWRLGAQVAILDYRLRPAEVDRAVQRLGCHYLAYAGSLLPTGGFGYVDTTVELHRRTTGGSPGGAPTPTHHALIQLSSGSTGPSKMIGRTADSLIAELERYSAIPGFTQQGGHSVVLASMLHVLGLCGGLLYNLYAGITTVVPQHISPDHVLTTARGLDGPTTIVGVPSHARLMAAAGKPDRNAFDRMLLGGEPVAEAVRTAFRNLFDADLGVMYGMTEVGVIATNLTEPDDVGLAPAPGMVLDTRDGEIVIAMSESPYVGITDPSRWSDGWLHTRDAGVIDLPTGRVHVLGRLDAQVSIGGLKVDLLEVEEAIIGLDGVDDAVVVFDGGIRAYVTGRDLESDLVRRALQDRLAHYKRPRAVHVMPAIPRTATGKPIRDAAVLRTTVG